jgi:hypothetical protein
MAAVNLVVGWLAILGGLLVGTAIGLFFDRDGWLGGYGSWRRRMVRLGHVALVGTGLLNLAFALSVEAGKLERVPGLASFLFVLGAATMAPVCFLAAWRKPLRHLFFVPVLSLVVACLDVLHVVWPP